MGFPIPEPGLVVSYSYLWRHEHDAGLEEGRKTRPCVIVLAVESKDGVTVVTVAPITHRKPANTTVGIAIPPRVKQHLGLDHEDSWVIVSEVNQFVWPGYDLRPVPGGAGRFDHDFLPPNLFNTIKAAMLKRIASHHAAVTPRD